MSGTSSGAEVNKGGPRWGRGGGSALLSKCINSKHMVAADTAQAAPQQSRCSARDRGRGEGPWRWPELPRARAPRRALGRQRPGGTRSSQPSGAGDPPTWLMPPPHFVWALGGSFPATPCAGAAPALRHPGCFGWWRLLFQSSAFVSTGKISPGERAKPPEPGCTGQHHNPQLPGKPNMPEPQPNKHQKAEKGLRKTRSAGHRTNWPRRGEFK